jgi:tight adherence protein B
MVLLMALALLAAVAFVAASVAGRPRPPSFAAARLARYVRGREPDPEGRGTFFTSADRSLLRLPQVHAIERRLHEAGVAAPVSAVLALTAAAAGAAGAIAGAVWGLWAAMSAIAATGIAAVVMLQNARDRWLRRIEAQLPAALDMLVGQLRSHRSIGEAVAGVAHWIADPLAAECARLAEELRIGMPLARALERFRDRVPVPAVPAIVTAIAVADRTGANLAECLARQAAAVRAQIVFRQELRAMTAHARATGTILALLPVGVAASMLLLDPGVVEPMTRTTPGRLLLAAAAAMELCGWQTIRWMIGRLDQ